MTEENNPLFAVYVEQPLTRVRVTIHLTNEVTNPFTYGAILADVVNSLADAIYEAELVAMGDDGKERRVSREEIANAIILGLMSELLNPTAQQVVPS